MCVCMKDKSRRNRPEEHQTQLRLTHSHSHSHSTHYNYFCFEKKKKIYNDEIFAMYNLSPPSFSLSHLKITFKESINRPQPLHFLKILI